MSNNNLLDARRYDEFTKTSFAHIYPLIARQILERTGIIQGICLEVGSGPAPLAIALAHLSDLQVVALDHSREMVSLISENVTTSHIENRVIPIIGDVHTLPISDELVDLVVSRGSYHFWNDLSPAFREIYWVLKPGCMAYIGGGYGSLSMKEKMLAERKKRKIDDTDNPPMIPFRRFHTHEIEFSLELAGIEKYQIINDETGFWILFFKRGMQ